MKWFFSTTQVIANMKNKIVILVIFVFTIVAVISFASKSRMEDNPEADKSHQTFDRQSETTSKNNQVISAEKAEGPSPTLASPFDQSTKKNASSEYQYTTPPTLQELAGPVNNSHGVRDDILEEIEKTIPKYNEKARKAAIKYAAVFQYIYYSANEKERIEGMKKMMTAMDCLSMSFEPWGDVTKKVRKLMHNTKARDAHIWEIDEKFFGEKIIEYPYYSEEEIKKICDTVDF